MEDLLSQLALLEEKRNMREAEREALRDAREAEREALRVAREAEREALRDEYEAEREARYAQQATELLAAVAAMQSTLALDAAFVAARSAGACFDARGLVAPFPAQALVPRGAVFAHRLLREGLYERMNLGEPTVADGVMLLNPPASAGKAGLPFFVVLSDDPAVLRAAHAYHHACSGNCLAYPLASIPPGMALTVDKVLVSVGGAPALLHASLSCLEPMPFFTFIEAVEGWAGRQVC